MANVPTPSDIHSAHAEPPLDVEVAACTEVHPLGDGDGEIRLLGAVRQVTGAMTHVAMGGARFLVDCGIAQGEGRSHQRTFPDLAREVDAVVLTHGHLDHIGNLPTLLDATFERPIYATAATLEIARISLEDSLSMQRLSEREIKQTLAQFKRLSKPLPYDRVTDIAGIKVACREAGHILGSASVELRSATSRAIISGDLGRPGSPILPDPNMSWESGMPIDVVVMESTYGSREHGHSHHDIEDALESILKRAIAEKGHVLIPAFAIGRTQVLLYFLNTLVESGRIPRIPVAIDTPMGLSVTETYHRFEKWFDKESLAQMASGDDPLDFDSLFHVRKGRDSAKLSELPGPLIIIAGSGMCTGGRIMNHLKSGLPLENTTVLFVGYQAHGTTGRRIMEAAARGGRSVRIDGEETPVRAHVEVLKGLSAHADRRELAAWLRAIPNVKRVALHHGDEDAQHDLARYLTGAD